MVFRKHRFYTAVKPHRTLRSILVHPKDKLLSHQKSEAIYEIPRADCLKSFIGETERSFGTSLQEPQKEVDKFDLEHTRGPHANCLLLNNMNNKPAITDHVSLTNHNIQ